jgi:hypothetical protein
MIEFELQISTKQATLRLPDINTESYSTLEPGALAQTKLHLVLVLSDKPRFDLGYGCTALVHLSSACSGVLLSSRREVSISSI